MNFLFFHPTPQDSLDQNTILNVSILDKGKPPVEKRSLFDYV